MSGTWNSRRGEDIGHQPRIIGLETLICQIGFFEQTEVAKSEPGLGHFWGKHEIPSSVSTKNRALD